MKMQKRDWKFTKIEVGTEHENIVEMIIKMGKSGNGIENQKSESENEKWKWNWKLEIRSRNGNWKKWKWPLDLLNY